MNNCLQKGKEKAFLNSHSVPKLSSKSEGKVKTFQICKDSEHISHTLRLWEEAANDFLQQNNYNKIKRYKVKK